MEHERRNLTLDSQKNQDPISKIDAKEIGNIRYVLFNINGIKTLCNYYPWNKSSNDFNKIFSIFQADIISLQELKITNNNVSSINLSNLENYRSFISLPQAKKGYSGVGLFVRIPKEEESDSIKHNLNIIKAEEGITGYLKVSTDSGVTQRYVDLDSSESIGGYITPENDEDFSLDVMKEIDKEGRAVVVEMANNLVVFSLYCPANSMQTETGEAFKNNFMDILLKRCKNLRNMGKDVLILGDINISLDLIDQADGINERVKKKLVKYYDDGNTFEKENLEECIKFKQERYSRLFLSKFVHQKINVPGLDDSQKFLYDTTRTFQGRKLGIFTCWNTMNGARQTNYGSRIDLILTTKTWNDSVVNSSHWPFLMGSDHCPIFTDFRIEDEVVSPNTMRLPLKFEARKFYKIVRHQDIASMFKAVQKRKIEDLNDLEAPKKEKLVYKSRKAEQKPKQAPISSFFKKNGQDSSLDASIHTLICENEYSQQPKTQMESRATLNFFALYGAPPKCKHGEACQLKTSLNNPSTRGKKFWCCSRNSVGLNDEGRCSYFKWLSETR